MKKINDAPEVSDLDPVSLYRSYGVRKKEGFFAHLNVLLARILATMLFTLLAIGLGMGLFAILYMLRALGVVIAAVAVLCIVLFGVLRVPRKRRKFIKKLKKVCRKNGYRLEFKRGFFDGMKKNDVGYDFIVKAKNTVWCARFFTCRKRATHLIFEDAHTVTIRTNIVKNKIKAVYGLADVRNKRIDYTFDDPFPPSVIPCRRALILNPVPHTIFKKDSDGVVGATGSGEEMYGYTVFTGSGFIETIQR